MQKQPIRKAISLLIIVSLMLSILPGSWAVNAVDEETIQISETNLDLAEPIQENAEITETISLLDADTVPEIIGYEEALDKNHVQRLYSDEGEDLNKVVFLNADGTKTMYLYDFPVKYVDTDGTVRDVSLDIADTTAGFETASGSTVTTFATNMSDGISLRGNDVEISLVPLLPVTIGTGSMASSASSAAGSAVSRTATRIDSKTIAYPFDAKTTIEYSLTYTGFKEDIVVSEYTGQTEYDFRLYTDGCALREINGTFCLVDDAGNIKATIGDIIIFTADERNNTFGQLVPTTIVENEQYLLTIVVDAEFLADEKTVYPIRIDPTIEIFYAEDNVGDIEDITVCSGTTYSGTSGSLYVGLKSGAGICRALMKFPIVEDLPDNITIQSAYIKVRDLMCESTAMDIECYVFQGNNWSESSASWSSTNAGSSGSIGTHLCTVTMDYDIGRTFTNKHWYSFDITEAVQGWVDGTESLDSGIIFKMPTAHENGSTYTYRTIGSYNRSSNQPMGEITYTEESVASVMISPTTATISTGGTQTLVATIYPTTAGDKRVTWSTSNPSIAEVSTVGVVTGVAPGQVTITCTSNDSGVKATCTITVNPISYTSMTEETAYAATLSQGKHFWYSFTPLETGYYMFRSSSDSSTDVKAYLFNETTELDRNDDGADEHRQFEIRYRLIAGTTYRLRVQGYSTDTTGMFYVSVSKCWPETSEPTMYTRSDWGALAVIAERREDRERDPLRIIYHHSADKFSSTDYTDCKDEIKRIQELHMNREEKCDIAYHFIIDPAGRIWQGAEIDEYKRGHATNHYDDIGVLVLGDFESRLANFWSPNTLNEAQKNAMITIGKWLCYKYELPISGTNCPITTHRQVNPDSTVCPGENMAPYVESTLLNTILNWRK